MKQVKFITNPHIHVLRNQNENINIRIKSRVYVQVRNCIKVYYVTPTGTKHAAKKNCQIVSPKPMLHFK